MRPHSLQGTFVKLSTRSPKYSTLALKRAATYLKSELERIEIEVQMNPVDEAQHLNLKNVCSAI